MTRSLRAPAARALAFLGLWLSTACPAGPPYPPDAGPRDAGLARPALDASAPRPRDGGARPPKVVVQLTMRNPTWRRLDALWFREDDGKTVARGVSTIHATIAPNPSEEVRVGVSEEYVGATGREWRASVWIGAFLAAELARTRLTDHQYIVSTGGFIDGPSAGALIAVGFAATLLDHPVRADSTITGALAPDGTVAPVGGILEKLRAAKGAGKTRLGIPAGQREQEDGDGGVVDAVLEGRRAGLEVVLLQTLEDAYRFLTDRAPPTPALAGASMELDPRVSAALLAQTRALVQRTEGSLLKRARRVATWIGRQIVRRAVVAVEEAKRFMQAGQAASAYFSALRGTALAQAVVRVLGKGPSEAALLAEAKSVERVGATLAKLERALDAALLAAQPRALAMVTAANATAQARGYLAVARALYLSAAERLDKDNAVSRALSALVGDRRLALPAVYLALCELAIERAELLLTQTVGPLAAPLRLDTTALQETTRSFVSAASGNIEYVDAVLISELATAAEADEDKVRTVFTESETSYLVASELAQHAVREQVESKRGDAPAITRLAAAAMAFVDSAFVTAKYYSLEAGLPDSNGESEVGRKAALGTLLERAEAGARLAASAASAKLGVVPPEAQLYYQAARELARGGDNARLRALHAYWRSTTASRLAAAVLRR